MMYIHYINKSYIAVISFDFIAEIKTQIAKVSRLDAA